MTTQAMVNGAGALAERVVAVGDLEGLQPMERARFYTRVCESLGLNPLTKPFEYIKLQGKLTLYARRDATEQLRKIHNVSLSIIKREMVEGLYIVTAHASTPNGRTDESIGAVVVGGLKGESLANAVMKAETKAKRRVTLSICGLGWLDETEVADVAAAKPVQVTADGEIVEPSEPEDLTKQLAASIDWARWVNDHLTALRSAADSDRGAFNEAWADIMDDVKRCAPEAKFIAALNAGKNDIKSSKGWK